MLSPDTTTGAFLSAITTICCPSISTLVATAVLTAPLPAANTQEFTNTTVYYEDRSGIKYFANCTELHFTHNITFPNYIYALSIHFCEVHYQGLLFSVVLKILDV